MSLWWTWIECDCIFSKAIKMPMPSTPLKKCILKNSLSQGKNIHSHIAPRRFAYATSKTFHHKLIDMYAECGTLKNARKVFDYMEDRNSFSWHAMIAAYKRHGFPHEVVTLFHHMQRTGFQPDRFTFASVIPAYANLGALEQGISIHKSIMDRGILSDVVVATALVNMYAKCGSIDKARKLFDEIPQRDVFSWTAMIAGYAQNGFDEKALETFKQMKLAGVKPDSTTFASILPACAKMKDLEQGMDIHRHLSDGGVLTDVAATALVNMYAKCGSVDKARELFDRLPMKDVFLWTAMIAGYAQNGFVEKALETFKQMGLASVKPNSTTFATVLPACTKMGALEQGIDMHQRIMERSFLSDIKVANALVDMYAKCGSIDKAREVFEKMPQRDAISWNAMIAGYTHNGFVEKALETFKQMQYSGVKPNSTTFASVLTACAKMGGLEQAMGIHQGIMGTGFLSYIVVENALIDMYAKCESMDKAGELFDKMPQRDVFSWTAMIAGYTQNGFFEKALETFKQMRLAGVKPNSATFASVLPACAKIGALEQGIHIHQSIMEGGLLSDIILGNALVDMYAKCGSIDKACELFHRMPRKNVASWNAMIAGYAQNGFCEDALKIFQLIKKSGTYPDIVSFVCVLHACSHAGLVDEGCTYFNHMSNHYCIIPRIDHYVCMVDLLARAGYLENTLNFIIKMPVKPVADVWLCFLGGCRSHVNIGLGVFTATILFDLDPENTAAYVLLSNIYAEVGRWDDVYMVRQLMKDRGIKKIPGCSWVEGRKMIHSFCVGERSHPRTQEIYVKLEKLVSKMKAAVIKPRGFLQWQKTSMERNGLFE